MKRTKHLRTLEELWDLEDKHPLVDASAAGLVRWMFATGTLAGSASNDYTGPHRKIRSSRRGKHGRF